MDLRKLKKLIDLVQESGISELEVTEGEEKVRIAKHSTGPAPMSYAPQAPVMHAAPAAAAPAAVAIHGDWPAMMRDAVTAAPVVKLPSTVRSGKSSTRNVRYTPRAIRP